MIRLTTLILMAALLSFSYDAQANNARPYRFVGGCNPVKIQNSAKMDKALREISRLAGGKRLDLLDCFRSQGRQNGLLKQRGCRPYGKRNCGSSVARRSQHTFGVAVDFRLGMGIKKSCETLNRARANVLGGRGGVGGYPGGSVHFDVRDRQSNWNQCARYLGLGPTYPRRGKVQDYRTQKQKEASGLYSSPRRGPVRAAREASPARAPASRAGKKGVFWQNELVTDPKKFHEFTNPDYGR